MKAAIFFFKTYKNLKNCIKKEPGPKSASVWGGSGSDECGSKYGRKDRGSISKGKGGT